MSNLLGPRDENGIPLPMTVDESIASMKASLLKKIKRSAYVYRVDCGGCNGCEIEIFATLSPLFDAERFGIKVVPSPRHADILLFTGAVTRAMRSPALRAAIGAGSENLHLLRCLRQQRRYLPRSVLRMGRHRQNRAGRCLYSGLSADACRHAVRFCDGAWSAGAKIHARQPGELDDQPTELLHPNMVQPLRVRIDREARRLAGYRYGRQIADDYMRLLGQGDNRYCAGWKRRKIRV